VSVETPVAEWRHRGHEPTMDDVVDAFDKIAAALSAETDLDGLLHLIAERACSIVGVSRCTLYLRDTDEGLYRGRVAHPGSRPAAEAWTKRSVAGIEADRFTQEILATKEPVVIVNALDDPRPVHRAMLKWDIRTMLGVPMILRDEVIGLLFFDNGALPYEFASATQRLAGTLANLSAVAIGQARRNAEMRKTLQTVVSQNRLLRQVSAMETQLSQQLLDGASLDQIADSIVSMTHHPCGIYDGDFELLALGLVQGDEAVIPRLMERSVLDLQEVATALSALQPGESKVIEPIPERGIHHRHLVARVHGEGEAAGYVVLMDHRQRLTAFDAMVVRRAATMVALELSAERRAFDADRHARESLVRDLLHGLDEQRSLRRRAGFHHLRLDEPHVLCLIARRGDSDGRPPALADIRNACGRIGWMPHPFCATDETGVALLLPLDRNQPPAAGLTKAKLLADQIVSNVDPGDQMIGAVSAVCTTIGHYPRALTETRQILKCMTSLLADSTVRVLSSDDLGAGRLLLGSTTPEIAERFALDAAGALLEDNSDRRHLLATLTAFCESNRSVRTTGSLLGIHENTVRYRLGKIAELTGLDVATNADDQLTAQLVLLVFKLRGWLGPWRKTLADSTPTEKHPDAAQLQSEVGSDDMSAGASEALPN